MRRFPLRCFPPQSFALVALASSVGLQYRNNHLQQRLDLSFPLLPASVSSGSTACLRSQQARTMSQQGSGGPGFAPLPLTSPPVSPTLPASANTPSSPRRGITQSLSSPLNPQRASLVPLDREGSSGSSSEGGGYQRNSASRQSHNGYTHARKDGSQQLDSTTLGQSRLALSLSAHAVFQLRGAAYQPRRPCAEQRRSISNVLIPFISLQVFSPALLEAPSVPSRALQLTRPTVKLLSLAATRWLHRT